MGVPGMRSPLAWMVALHVAWGRTSDPEAARVEIWKRAAFAMRYGHVGLDVLTLPLEGLTDLNQALGSLVEEENRANKSPR